MPLNGAMFWTWNPMTDCYVSQCLTKYWPKPVRSKITFSSILSSYFNEGTSTFDTAASTLPPLFLSKLAVDSSFCHNLTLGGVTASFSSKDTERSCNTLTSYKLFRLEALKIDLQGFRVEISAIQLPWKVSVALQLWIMAHIFINLTCRVYAIKKIK